MIKQIFNVSHFSNPEACGRQHFPESLKTIFSLDDAEHTYQQIRRWPGYAVTELHRLDGLAAELRVEHLWYKDESSRFGLGSFKALGGAYAVFVELQRFIKTHLHRDISLEDMISGSCSDFISSRVVTCATDGNHGRSVAWGAKLFGCKCVIYLHSEVSAGREKALRELGADVVRVEGNYDDSVRKAADHARQFHRILVSDTSNDDNLDVPRQVTLGYTVMLKEIIEQLAGERPTHVFIQGGVGGIASAVCSYFWQHWGEDRPRLIVVEPDKANCLQLSARQGQTVNVEGELDTLMAGMACGEVSLLAWQILKIGADDFVTVEDASVVPCMKLLADGRYGDQPIVAGESAVAGVAALIGSMQSPELAKTLSLDNTSRVLVIGTEGDTDPDLYQLLINSQN